MRMGILAALSLLLAQSPPPTASVEGVVTKVGTSQPIADARVLLTSSSVTGPSGALAEMTDANGRFAFQGIDPGQYRIDVAADGYARIQYGQRVPTGLEGKSGSSLGTLLSLNEGQRLQGISVSLTPTGNISGAIRSSNGRPVADVPVQLLRSVYSSNGEKTYTEIENAKTDDRGEYRLYWITPGQYVVAAGFTAGLGIAGTRGLDPSAVGAPPLYSTTYYPGVADIAVARPITVTPGSESSGINLLAEPLKLYEIRGRIVDLQTGRSPASASPYINYVSGSGAGGIPNFPSYDAADGTFELHNVPPGSYLLGISAPAASPVARLLPITVTNKDVEGVALNMIAPVSVPTNITVNHKALSSVPGLDRLRVSLVQSVDGKQLKINAVTSITPSTGASTFNNILPGEFALTFGLPASGFYVREATYKGQDALNAPLQISGSEPGVLNIDLATNPGQIDGTIRNDANQTVAGMRVVLVPDLHSDRTELYKVVNADAAGHFIVPNVAPGDYRLFAWESIEPYSWYDADIIKRYEPQGKTVHVTESSNTTADIRAIP